MKAREIKDGEVVNGNFRECRWGFVTLDTTFRSWKAVGDFILSERMIPFDCVMFNNE